MAEGEKGKERQTIVSDLFPLRGQSVEAAFEPFNPNEEKRMLSETNPHVLNYFEALTGHYAKMGQYAKDETEQALLGILICHRALREEARFRGGVLPTLTERFVDNYNENLERNVHDELGDKKLDFDETRKQIHRANLVIFRNFEPAFSWLVEEKFRDQTHPEDSFRNLGIINMYLLFREGCSHSENF